MSFFTAIQELKNLGRFEEEKCFLLLLLLHEKAPQYVKI
jgi:hypothetical protein